MKLELKIEAPGVQIYAYEIDQEIQGLIDKNADDGFPVRVMEIVEERVSPILISNGIPPRKNSCKHKAIIAGEERGSMTLKKVFVIDKPKFFERFM